MRVLLRALALLLVAGPLSAAALLAAAGSDWADDALKRVLAPPLGLPAIAHPTANPPTAAKIALGRKLFFDRRLSHNNTTSCAMCHVPEQGFTSNDLATPVGVEGRSVRRNTPTVLNVAYVDALFHDGRDPALETQYVAPITAFNEMANPSLGYVIDKIANLDDYTALFQAAFGAGPSPDRVGHALAVYQRSLLSGASPFDRWRYGGEADALGARERQGFELFTGKAGCVACHSIGKSSALFSDGLFHDTGYGWQREQERQGKGGLVEVEIAPGVVTSIPHSVVQSVGNPPAADLGRYEVTQEPVDRWRFRTPSLRNVTLTAPYMHDGQLQRLDDVVAFYNAGGVPHDGLDERIKPLGLTVEEQVALVAFLKSLTGSNIDQLTAEARVEEPDNIR
jgi:cytochrome c peroxidase